LLLLFNSPSPTARTPPTFGDEPLPIIRVLDTAFDHPLHYGSDPACIPLSPKYLPCWRYPSVISVVPARTSHSFSVICFFQKGSLPMYLPPRAAFFFGLFALDVLPRLHLTDIQPYTTYHTSPRAHSKRVFPRFFFCPTRMHFLAFNLYFITPTDVSRPLEVPEFVIRTVLSHRTGFSWLTSTY